MEATLQNPGYLYTFSKGSFGKKESRIQNLLNNKKEGIILTLIADDHPYLIHGVENDLNKDPKIKIVCTVNSYDELTEKTKELQPDIILLDLKMPGREKHDLKDLIKNLIYDYFDKPMLADFITGGFFYFEIEIGNFFAGFNVSDSALGNQSLEFRF